MVLVLICLYPPAGNIVKKIGGRGCAAAPATNTLARDPVETTSIAKIVEAPVTAAT
jgi:hypothetical protein